MPGGLGIDFANGACPDLCRSPGIDSNRDLSLLRSGSRGYQLVCADRCRL